MATVKIEQPEMITVSFRQERGDKDYGSCLWARFNFDTKHYHLSIESDCGTYSNGWVPTPNHETFLHLCARFDEGYLLEKLDNRSVVDGKATFKSLMEHLEDYDCIAYEELTVRQLEYLENACCCNRTDRDCLDSIMNELDDTGFSGSCSVYDIACCIETTYPEGTKKIVQIFKDYIQPELRKLEEG